jgi:hypothetical protein
MSIDTAFKPTAATITVGTAAVQVSQVGGPGAITTYRVRCLAATGQTYFSWGPTAAIAAANLATTPPAPTSPGSVGMFPSTVETFELPAGSFVIAAAAAAFEFTPGQGA